MNRKILGVYIVNILSGLHSTDRVMTPLSSSSLLPMPVFSIMTGIFYTGSLWTCGGSFPPEHTQKKKQNQETRRQTTDQRILGILTTLLFAGCPLFVCVFLYVWCILEFSYGITMSSQISVFFLYFIFIILITTLFQTNSWLFKTIMANDNYHDFLMNTAMFSVFILFVLC